MSTDRSSTLSELFAELLARARQGDSAAKSQLLEQQRKHLLEIAGRGFPQEIQGRVDPSDAVQETLMLAHRKFEDFRGDTLKSFSDWLWVMLTNTRRRLVQNAEGLRRRHGGREISLDDVSVAAKFVYDPGPSVVDALIEQEQNEIAQCCFEWLPERYRQVLQRRYDDDSVSLTAKR